MLDEKERSQGGGVVRKKQQNLTQQDKERGSDLFISFIPCLSL